MSYLESTSLLLEYPPYYGKWVGDNKELADNIGNYERTIWKATSFPPTFLR